MIEILERDLSAAELARVHAGFDEHGLEFGNPPTTSLRVGFVALDGKQFVGCSSGLACDTRRWFYLTDLFVEKPARRRGLGAALLRALETKVAGLGGEWMWTW